MDDYIKQFGELNKNRYSKQDWIKVKLISIHKKLNQTLHALIIGTQ